MGHRKTKRTVEICLRRMLVALFLMMIGSLLMIVIHSIQYQHYPVIKPMDLEQKVHEKHPMDPQHPHQHSPHPRQPNDNNINSNNNNNNNNNNNQFNSGNEKSKFVEIDLDDPNSLDNRIKTQMQLVILAKKKPVSEKMQQELLDDAVTFHVGNSGENCHETCAAQGHRSCMVHWFEMINECPILLEAFDSEKCVDYHFGRDLPAYRASSRDVLINSRFQDYPTSCDAQYATGERLCPCGMVQEEVRNEVTDRVREPILKRLAILHDIDAKHDEKKIGYRNGHRWGAYTGGPSPGEMIQNVHEKRVRFFTSAMGQHCYDVCKSRGTSCLRYWFDVVNDCSILGAAFPDNVGCLTHLYGRDLPGYKPMTKQLLVNSDTRTYGPCCLGNTAVIEKLCACGFPKGGSTTSNTFHVVYNVQPSRYFEWQVRYMHFWANEVGQPGKVTRLLSASKMDHLTDIPTHVAPAYDMSKDAYLPYNKPRSVAHWLKNAKPEEDVIIIIDPDCCFIRKVDIAVEEGSPIAQPAFYGFDVQKPISIPNQIAERYCSKCAFVDPIAVPIIIHRKDIEKIAPLWLEKTELMRRERTTWPEAWSDAKLSPVTLGWTAEMFGYVFAAAELGIRHEIVDMQVVTPIHKKLLAPFIHYHVAVNVGNVKWHKGNEDAGRNIPWPLADDLDEVTVALMTKLKNASMHLAPTNHVWPPNSGIYQPEF